VVGWAKPSSHPRSNAYLYSTALNPAIKTERRFRPEDVVAKNATHVPDSHLLSSRGRLSQRRRKDAAEPRSRAPARSQPLAEPRGKDGRTEFIAAFHIIAPPPR
jgi:hypothetical protein